MKHKTLTNLRNQREETVIFTEHWLLALGYTKVSPEGYVDFYRGTHFKARYEHADGSLWIIEGMNESSAVYIIEQVVA